MKQHETIISELDFVTQKLIEIMQERGHDESVIKLYTERALKLINTEEDQNETV
jgi:hypothetical protein